MVNSARIGESLEVRYTLCDVHYRGVIVCFIFILSLLLCVLEFVSPPRRVSEIQACI